MYRKKVKIEKTEDLKLTIQLPENYLHKEVEITADEIKNGVVDEVNDFSDAEAFF